MPKRKCEVCEDAESKYKCPTCFLPYCSLPCYKLHKNKPCLTPRPVAVEPPCNAQPPRHFESEDDDSGTRLPMSKLEAVAASEEVRLALRDERLQALVRKIDSSPIPEKDLDEAMETPEFREFADKVLAALNPEKYSPSLLHPNRQATWEQPLKCGGNVS